MVVFNRSQRATLQFPCLSVIDRLRVKNKNHNRSAAFRIPPVSRHYAVFTGRNIFARFVFLKLNGRFEYATLAYRSGH